MYHGLGIVIIINKFDDFVINTGKSNCGLASFEDESDFITALYLCIKMKPPLSSNSTPSQVYELNKKAS